LEGGPNASDVKKEEKEKQASTKAASWKYSTEGSRRLKPSRRGEKGLSYKREKKGQTFPRAKRVALPKTYH